MSTMFIEKINIKDLEEAIANSTPLLALVGAGDLAYEKFRAARDELVGRAASFDPKAVRDQAQTGFAARVDLLSEMMPTPERIQALPEKAQEWPTKAQSIFADVLSTAFSTYGELAGRGKTRVDQVRRDFPGGVEVDVEVKPVSRPKTSTARKTSTTAKKPVAKKTSTTAKTTTKPAAKKTASKASTASTGSAGSTASKTTTTSTSTTTESAATPNTTPSTGSADAQS